jgi:hemerythrin-like metal-binding protein
MEPLEWKDSFSVGNAHLDEQHKGLIALINMLDDADMTGPVLEQLQIYGEEHFRDEERLMEEAGYDGLPAHREQHAAFVEWLESAHQAQRRGEVAALLRDGVRDYLKNWLVNHILVSDKDYAPHLK